jgi:YidC/Oxa1 family membrane protein insertase
MDKKTVLAIILSMGVIFAWQMFFLPKAPPPQPGPVTVSSPPPGPAPTPVSPVSLTAVGGASSPTSPAGSGAPDREIAVLLESQERSAPRVVKITTPLCVVMVDGKTGAVTSWRLLKYLDTQGLPLEMLPEPVGSPAPLSLRFREEALTRYFSGGPWVVEGDDRTLDSSGPPAEVTLSRIDPDGLLVTRKLVFRADSYSVATVTEVRNLGKVAREVPWWLVWGPGLGREKAPDSGVYSGPLVSSGGKVAQEQPKKDGESLAVAPGFSWLGLTDRYFLTAFLPSDGERDGFITREKENTYRLGLGPRSGFLSPGGVARLETAFFVGPKSFEVLRSLNVGLENALDFGWFGWLGRPLLTVLKLFQGFSGSWGMAIILLTLLVKLLLFPVTFNMYKSMRRMQEVQPQIAVLKKKHKDDPQALNQAMMDLYRSHKINPAGGCLPMIIQIPIFLALYKVLSIAIELRGASFLHIRDLSAGETTLGLFINGLLPAFPPGILPLKILVILMGVTMFIQQKLSPSMGDSAQAKMMMFFPLIFTAMFWNFSSGLVVYFLFSNILAIGEQLLIRKLTTAPTVEVVPVEGKKKVR